MGLAWRAAVCKDIKPQLPGNISAAHALLRTTNCGARFGTVEFLGESVRRDRDHDSVQRQ